MDVTMNLQRHVQHVSAAAGENRRNLAHSTQRPVARYIHSTPWIPPRDAAQQRVEQQVDSIAGMDLWCVAVAGHLAQVLGWSSPNPSLYCAATATAVNIVEISQDHPVLLVDH